MESEADRKRLLNLFRAPLEEGDILNNPDVLSHTESAPQGFAPVSLSPHEGPVYGTSATTVAPSSVSGRTMVTLVVIVVLIGIIVYLLVTMRYRVVTDERMLQSRSKAILDDDEEEDDEVMQITNYVAGELPVEVSSEEIAKKHMARAQRGMPQMGQMRPSNHAPGNASGRSDAESATKLRRHEGDNDPMFQTLE